MKKIHFSESRYYPNEVVFGIPPVPTPNTKNKYRTLCGVVIEGRRRTKDAKKVTCKACIAVLTSLRLKGLPTSVDVTFSYDTGKG